MGEAGLAEFQREMSLRLWECRMVGAHAEIPTEGYATGGRAAAAWATRFGVGRTVCLISPENVASVRVAENVGTGALPQSSLQGQPISMYRDGESGKKLAV